MRVLWPNFSGHVAMQYAEISHPRLKTHPSTSAPVSEHMHSDAYWPLHAIPLTAFHTRRSTTFRPFSQAWHGIELSHAPWLRCTCWWRRWSANTFTSLAFGAWTALASRRKLWRICAIALCAAPDHTFSSSAPQEHAPSI